jgi:hypothetical protein
MLDGHFEQAVEIAKRAKQYLLQRKFEIARYEILKVGGISTIVLLVAAFILWLIKDFAIGLLGLNFYTILLASLFGGVGAYLSVIQRIGNQNIDYNSPKYLLQLEGISRSTAGIISAIIVCLAFKLGIVLTILSQGSHSLLAMIFGSILAGYSERLAPSIVKSVEDTTDSSGLGPGQ